MAVVVKACKIDKVVDKYLHILYSKYNRLLFTLNKWSTLIWEFQEKLHQEYQIFCFQNIEESEKKCRDTIVQLYNPISEAYQKGDYARPSGYKAYKEDMEDLEIKYRKTKGKGLQVRLWSYSVVIILHQFEIILWCRRVC